MDNKKFSFITIWRYNKKTEQWRILSYPENNHLQEIILKWWWTSIVKLYVCFTVRHIEKKMKLSREKDNTIIMKFENITKG